MSATPPLSRLVAKRRRGRGPARDDSPNSHHHIPPVPAVVIPTKRAEDPLTGPTVSTRRRRCMIGAQIPLPKAETRIATPKPTESGRCQRIIIGIPYGNEDALVDTARWITTPTVAHSVGTKSHLSHFTLRLNKQLQAAMDEIIGPQLKGDSFEAAAASAAAANDRLLDDLLQNLGAPKAAPPEEEPPDISVKLLSKVEPVPSRVQLERLEPQVIVVKPRIATSPVTSPVATQGRTSLGRTRASAPAALAAPFGTRPASPFSSLSSPLTRSEEDWRVKSRQREEEVAARHLLLDQLLMEHKEDIVTQALRRTERAENVRQQLLRAIVPRQLHWIHLLTLIRAHKAICGILEESQRSKREIERTVHAMCTARKFLIPAIIRRRKAKQAALFQVLRFSNKFIEKVRSHRIDKDTDIVRRFLQTLTHGRRSYYRAVNQFTSTVHKLQRICRNFLAGRDAQVELLVRLYQKVEAHELQKCHLQRSPSASTRHGIGRKRKLAADTSFSDEEIARHPSFAPSDSTPEAIVRELCKDFRKQRVRGFRRDVEEWRETQWGQVATWFDEGCAHFFANDYVDVPPQAAPSIRWVPPRAAMTQLIKAGRTKAGLEPLLQ
eukprot:TRINITY_DN6253_c0_g1_i1.p1 TRINITY_DN6253_c0_g1~~TRINITY_DN6253_c0_g1_i1.p1  ORF type:complete len:608 (+),score=46.59 TRINITY_DN6253_c0_g1_i1:36-1859(+)